MGVEFFPCDYCGESICDCGSYTYCRDICGRKWCDDKCAAAEGWRADKEDADDPNDFSCNFCRDEDAEDSDLLKFLMKKYNLTREKLLKMYFKEKPS
jgi:hypothetical protein